MQKSAVMHQTYGLPVIHTFSSNKTKGRGWYEWVYSWHQLTFSLLSADKISWFLVRMCFFQTHLWGYLFNCFNCQFWTLFHLIILAVMSVYPILSNINIPVGAVGLCLMWILHPTLIMLLMPTKTASLNDDFRMTSDSRNLRLSSSGISTFFYFEISGLFLYECCFNLVLDSIIYFVSIGVLQALIAF